MGSVPSSPNGISANSDPWWSIENQILNLDQSPLQINMNTNDQQEGHQINISQNNSSSNNNNNSCSEENSTLKTIENVCEIKKNDAKCSIEQLTQKQQQLCCTSSSLAATTNIGNKEITQQCTTVIHKEQSLDEFKEDLRQKREQRQSALAELRTEIVHLKSKLSEQREVNRKLRRQQCKQIFIDLDHSIESGSPSSSFSLDDDCDDDVEYARKIQQQENDKINYDNGDDDAAAAHHSRDISLKSELAQCQLSLQLANGETLSLSSELKATQKQVLSLKEVIRVTKEMVAIRDEHLVEVFIYIEIQFLYLFY